MISYNRDWAALAYPLPPEIERRKAAGDLSGALRLIDRALEKNDRPELAPRLRCERVRLARLPLDYPYSEAALKAMLRAEWPGMTDGQFQALVDNRRADWRMIQGAPHYHADVMDSLRIYPGEAVGLTPDPDDGRAERDALLARMRQEGSLTARITVKATVRSRIDVSGKPVQAWLPLPAACLQQSDIEILDCTPGGAAAPMDAPQRTMYWEAMGQDAFTVTYRYTHKAVYTDPMDIVPAPAQPTFDLEEEAPHLLFTPYLRALAQRVTAGCAGPVAKARAIYDYVTQNVDYRYQPAYLQLEPIADHCARELRGDCGLFALLFIALCRLNGIPARWQSGLAVRPGSVGAHDWAMFYIAPHGWLWADCSFGSSARRAGNEERRLHYFGSMDPWRMVANSACYAPLTPPDPAWRDDPYDNQRGEMTVDGRGLTDPEMDRAQELVSFEYL